MNNLSIRAMEGMSKVATSKAPPFEIRSDQRNKRWQNHADDQMRPAKGQRRTPLTAAPASSDAGSSRRLGSRHDDGSVDAMATEEFESEFESGDASVMADERDDCCKGPPAGAELDKTLLLLNVIGSCPGEDGRDAALLGLLHADGDAVDWPLSCDSESTRADVNGLVDPLVTAEE